MGGAVHFKRILNDVAIMASVHLNGNANAFLESFLI